MKNSPKSLFEKNIKIIYQELEKTYANDKINMFTPITTQLLDEGFLNQSSILCNFYSETCINATKELHEKAKIYPKLKASLLALKESTKKETIQKDYDEGLGVLVTNIAEQYLTHVGNVKHQRSATGCCVIL